MARIMRMPFGTGPYVFGDGSTTLSICEFDVICSMKLVMALLNKTLV